MKATLKIVLVSSLIALSQTTMAAGDAANGKSKSITCTACHGADGNSVVSNYPNLAGQKEAYLEKQMKDFKSNTRKDPTMNAMVAALSDQDMADLATFYSTQVAK